MKGEKMKKISILLFFVFVCSYFVFADIFIPPTDITVSIVDNDVMLAWSDSTDADMYYIYRSTQAYTDFGIIDSSLTTDYIDEDAATASTKYFYYVTAINPCESVTDIDGNVYQTIQIGNQCWMAENLKVTHYSNGDAIPNVTNTNTWINLVIGSYCVYDNDTTYIDEYGILYNWYTVDDPRRLAPEGWHVPTDEDWNTLVNYIGGSTEGGKLKETGYEHWNPPNTGATNESGYTALPAGGRFWVGNFISIGEVGCFWSTAETSSGNAWYRVLYYNNKYVNRNNCLKYYGFSIRCVRD